MDNTWASECRGAICGMMKDACSCSHLTIDGGNLEL